MPNVKRAHDRPGLPAQLVDEAARLLVEQGPGGLSLRKLAASVGVSTMPVYTLFGDKRGLLSAMHREGFRRLGEVLGAVPQTDDPVADLNALGVAYRRAALASPHLYGLMFGRVVPEFQPDEEERAAADATYRPLVDAVARCLQTGALSGALVGALVGHAPDAADRIALHLWSVAHGMVNLELNRQLPDVGEPEELYAEALAFAAMPFFPLTTR
jgi:AcrR family transcriptional regulator